MYLKQFSQGLYVATAAITSILTLGYMMDDIHKTEIKQLRNNYEEQIKLLNNEIRNQQMGKDCPKMNYSK
jgi:hypothetical protein